VRVSVDVTPEFEAWMRETDPKALCNTDAAR
jgi:hypothetical protein